MVSVKQKAAAARRQRQLEQAQLEHTRLREEAARFCTAHEDGLLDLGKLGGARPPEATHGEDWASKPFACAVRIEVRGLSRGQAVEQGQAVVNEVVASLERGPQVTSSGGNRRLPQARPDARHHFMWENLGGHSIVLEPTKSNNIPWCNKDWALRSELDPSSPWRRQWEMLGRVLPHADAWVRVLQLAREDGGIDIKDDCRVEDCSARCHQDGSNSASKGNRALVRFAINVSSVASGRSLDYLEVASDKRLVDGAEREALLVHSISQHLMWHGAAQTPEAYVHGVSSVCHSSSAGSGPCLKRIITVFRLPHDHPLARLSAVQRLLRVGIAVFAVDPRHVLLRPPEAEEAAAAEAAAPMATGAEAAAATGAAAAEATAGADAAAADVAARGEGSEQTTSRRGVAPRLSPNQAVLQSTAYRTYSRAERRSAGEPHAPEGELPESLRAQTVLTFDPAAIDLRGAVAELLRRGGCDAVGRFAFAKAEAAGDIERFCVAPAALCTVKGEENEAQVALGRLVAADGAFLSAYDRLLEEVVLPELRKRLAAAGVGADGRSVRFHCQRPPTLTLQPPSGRHVKPFTDAEHGGQRGELRCWLPLTDIERTCTTLWLEPAGGAADAAPATLRHGELLLFHGVACRQRLPPNPSRCCRVSLDFRVGVEGFYDADWPLGVGGERSQYSVPLA